MLAALAIIWGGSFFFAEIALRELPPMTITLHRVFWALPILIFVIWAKGITPPKSLKVWGAYLTMGALNNALPFSLIFWGQTQITSGLASILNGATGVTGVIVAGLFLSDERLTPTKLIGVVVGFFGVALTVGIEALQNFDLRSLAQMAILLAGLSYSIAGVWAKLRLSGQKPEMNALGMLLCSTVIMCPLALYIDGTPQFDLQISTWSALLALAVICTSLSYLLYFNILNRAGSGNLMLVTLLIPPFAITLGVLVLGESLAPISLVGFAFIALGLIIIDGRVIRLLQRSFL
jgi:drug/metabolite transporter (DMT)-like permease|tara:strand:- start:3870 stop:4745 length:876 start_codon:yes stop_codon:yes gene_type:complete